LNNLKYGKENIKDMFDYIEKEDPFLEKYQKEFEKNGIDNLKLSTDLDKTT